MTEAQKFVLSKLVTALIVFAKTIADTLLS